MSNCPDCAAGVGCLHSPGCGIEHCPRCGYQMISCDCVYDVCGINMITLEQTDPHVYNNGPTDAMYAQWDAEWGLRRMPWTGEYPGKDAARQFGLYVKWVEDAGWVTCGIDDPDATPDLNRLRTHAHWDSDSQKWVRNGLNRSVSDE